MTKPQAISFAEVDEALDAMNKAPISKRCGNCEHASRIDIQTIKCYGVPPVPVVIGGSQGAFGKVNLNVELMRPQLSVNEKPCGLWVLSQVNPLLNLPGMKSA